MDKPSYDKQELQIAIEKFYAGQMVEGIDWEATEDYTQAERERYTVSTQPRYTVQKYTSEQEAYKQIARALYKARPNCPEDDKIMCLYLVGIQDMVKAFSYDEQFDKALFLDLAAIEERDGQFRLLPF